MTVKGIVMEKKKLKCNIAKCKAACCYNIMLDKKLIGAYRKKIVNPIIRDSEGFEDDKIFAITDDDPTKNKCPFLRADFRCNIYLQRPQVCRDFGDGGSKSKFLHCHILTGEPGMDEREMESAIRDALSFATHINNVKEIVNEKKNGIR